MEPFGEGDFAFKDLSDLPFVQNTDAGRNYWAVQPTGDAQADFDLGEEYGRLAVAWVRRRKPSSLLFFVHQAMTDDATRRIQIGFWGAVQVALRQK